MEQFNYRNIITPIVTNMTTSTGRVTRIGISSQKQQGTCPELFEILSFSKYAARTFLEIKETRIS
jgi:hypothetical protein